MSLHEIVIREVQRNSSVQISLPLVYNPCRSCRSRVYSAAFIGDARIARLCLGTMAELWSLRGLPWWELARRTCRRSWQDEVFGQAARLTFYYFLGIFPALLLLLVVLNTLASTGSEFRSTLRDSFHQIMAPAD